MISKVLIFLYFLAATPTPVPTPRIGQFVCTRINTSGNCAINAWVPLPTPGATPTPNTGPYCGAGLVMDGNKVCIQ